MKRCPYCNKNIWDGAVECNYCGAQFGIQRKKQEEERKNFLANFVKDKQKNGFSVPNTLHSEIARYLETSWSEALSAVEQTSSLWCDKASDTIVRGILHGKGWGIPIEVPSDQYASACKFIKRAYTDYSDYEAVGGMNGWLKKSDLTYTQAKNIAKAGNIDSLIFDAKKAVISTHYVAGISFLISYARYKWSGIDNESALRCALGDALQSGGIVALTTVLSSQLMRTSAASGLTSVMRPGVKALYQSSSLGKVAIEKLASATAGKALSGAAAINSVSKLLRSNVITSCISTAVITAPDLYRAAISRNISWAQFGKNLAINAGGVIGSAGGWAAGAAAGAAAGSLVPGVGNVVGGIIGGIVGALGGGWFGSSTTQKGMDLLVKDDAEEMLEIVQEVFEQLCYDYLLSKEEVDKATFRIQKVINEDWLREMYSKNENTRKAWGYRKFEPIFEEVIEERQFITLPKQEELEKLMITLCGVVDEVATKAPKCPECSKVMPQGAKFCSECGSKLG